MQETNRNSQLIPAKEIAVCVYDKEIKTAGGFFLSNNSDSKVPAIAKIVDIGEGQRPLEFQIGDYLVYQNYGAYEATIGGERFFFVPFNIILGVYRYEVTE